MVEDDYMPAIRKTWAGRCAALKLKSGTKKRTNEACAFMSGALSALTATGMPNELAETAIDKIATVASELPRRMMLMLHASGMSVAVFNATDFEPSDDDIKLDEMMQQIVRRVVARNAATMTASNAAREAFAEYVKSIKED